jgi:hypothetical protein
LSNLDPVFWIDASAALKKSGAQPAEIIAASNNNPVTVDTEETQEDTDGDEDQADAYERLRVEREKDRPVRLLLF